MPSFRQTPDVAFKKTSETIKLLSPVLLIHKSELQMTVERSDNNKVIMHVKGAVKQYYSVE